MLHFDVLCIFVVLTIVCLACAQSSDRSNAVLLIAKVQGEQPNLVAKTGWAVERERLEASLVTWWQPVSE